MNRAHVVEHYQRILEEEAHGLRNERNARRVWEEEPSQEKGCPRPFQRDVSLKKSDPAIREEKKVCRWEKKSVTRQPEQARRTSRRSGEAEHGRGPSAREHQQDGHSGPDAVTRSGGNGRAVHASTRDRLGQQAALAARKAARRG
jgi:hypothetical protein